ncbi:MAG TPA: FAD-dependent monooxygenase [Candidatus Binatia bacterium]|jgi:2-polyprenyl-6-methoxyphenol hydroxylase-like FAD-dependent oxidoreductase
MKVGIIGGGPAGLYFALLMKKHDPQHEIEIVEQNPPDSTYGWGVVFSGRALSFLEESDRDSYADIARRLELWDQQGIVHKSQRVAIRGGTFSGLARIDLLRILQEHCRKAGVIFHFQTRVSDPELFSDCDLVVGADGVNSIVRQKYREHFQPTLDVRSNKYVWYGTNQRFDSLTLIFRQNQDGVFVAHSYSHSKSASTFIVECDAPTWVKAGFESMTDEESRSYCEEVFKDDLGGHTLLSNKSVWINFVVVGNRRWSYKNIVLIGDALRTVHFSIGSGTRTAFEDAIALYRTCAANENVEAALGEFERSRKPTADRLLEVAHHSLVWYERFGDKMDLDPIPFAYDYMTRGGRIDHEKLRERDPEFIAAYEAYKASQS